MIIIFATIHVVVSVKKTFAFTIGNVVRPFSRKLTTLSVYL